MRTPLFFLFALILVFFSFTPKTFALGAVGESCRVREDCVSNQCSVFQTGSVGTCTSPYEKFGDCSVTGNIDNCADLFPNTTLAECRSAGVTQKICDSHFLEIVDYPTCVRAQPDTPADVALCARSFPDSAPRNNSAGSSGSSSGTNVSGSAGTSGNTVTNTGQNITLLNPLSGGATLEGFLTSILSFVVRIGAIVVVLMLIYVGYLFVIARGDPSKLTEARSAFLWTLIGALILLGAQAIAYGIQATVQALSVGQ